NASESPDAWKNDCPWEAIALKMLSVVVVGPPIHVHEQLRFLIVLLAAMVFKMSLGRLKLNGLPSKTTILDKPGAMAMAISMSSETSPFPLSAPVVGTPSYSPIKTAWMTIFVRPPPAALA